MNGDTAFEVTHLWEYEPAERRGWMWHWATSARDESKWEQCDGPVTCLFCLTNIWKYTEQVDNVKRSLNREFVTGRLKR